VLIVLDKNDVLGTKLKPFKQVVYLELVYTFVFFNKLYVRNNLNNNSIAIIVIIKDI